MERPVRMRRRSPELQHAAYEMRQNLTPAEEKLWEAIRNKQVAGLRFRCQHAFDRFILDFYCASHRFGVEVDGEIHNTKTPEDEIRTQHLNMLGIQVLRFTNEQVFDNLNEVLRAIEDYASTIVPRFSSSSTPQQPK